MKIISLLLKIRREKIKLSNEEKEYIDKNWTKLGVIENAYNNMWNTEYYIFSIYKSFNVKNKMRGIVFIPTWMLAK